jgi:LEA14-like dessication related protein
MIFRLLGSRISGLLLLAFLVTGCVGQTSLVAPELEAAGVRLESVGLLQQQFLVTLRVYNPNTVPLPIKHIDYKFDLGGSRLAQGESAVAFSIPSHESKEFDLRMRTDLLSSARSLQKWLSGSPEDIDYELSGSVKVDIPFVKPFPFEQKGKIPLTLAQ